MDYLALEKENKRLLSANNLPTSAACYDSIIIEEAKKHERTSVM